MSSLAEDLPDVFERLGRITLRRMFGGHGVYHDGSMFGLVVGGQLYLKVDTESLPVFTDRGLPPFEYLRKGRTVYLSYHEAPAEIFEDRHEAAWWGRLAWQAAVRSAAAPARKIRPKAAR